jgi:hypothetical protein
LVMPYCDSQAMSEHLKEISAQVEPGHHAAVLLDQAGVISRECTLARQPVVFPDDHVFEHAAAAKAYVIGMER